MTVDDLIEKLEELKRRGRGNGDLPVVLGLSGETMPDEIFVDYYKGHEQLPYVRICSIKDERLGPETFRRFS